MLKFRFVLDFPSLSSLVCAAVHVCMCLVRLAVAFGYSHLSP